MSQKVILITGGSEGLGYAIADTLVKDINNKIIILARSEENLKRASQNLKCDYIICDISDPKIVENSVQQIIDKYNRIDILINNAGTWINGEIQEYTPDQISALIDVNIKGMMYMTNEVSKFMVNVRSGLIINIGSQAGLYPSLDRSLYGSSKWAVTGFTKNIQHDLLKYKVRCTGIYPARIKTDLFKKSNFDDAEYQNQALDPKQVAAIVKFVIDSDPEILIPEIGIRSIKQITDQTILY